MRCSGVPLRYRSAGPRIAKASSRGRTRHPKPIGANLAVLVLDDVLHLVSLSRFPARGYCFVLGAVAVSVTVEN